MFNLMAHSELVAALCTALTFVCASQILITCFLAFAFSQFMTVLHCTMATAAGVMSGLVTVPAVIQLRASQVSTHVRKKYGYTIWYKRVAIGMCTLLQSITWLLTLIDIFTPYDEQTFLDFMKYYNKKMYSKSIVDNIQWFLQCCGSESYDDWFLINWGGFNFDTFPSRKKKSIKELLYDNTDFYPDLSTFRNDAVPFSCCAEVSNFACIHQNLIQLGTFTINTTGCTLRLAATKNSILYLEFAIYSICLVLQITILTLLKTTFDLPHDVEQQPLKRLHSNEKREFNNFTNDVNVDYDHGRYTSHYTQVSSSSDECSKE